MSSLFQNMSIKVTSSIVVACFLGLQTVSFFPRHAYAASASDDLKKIEYKYYFRGNYAKTIAELRTFLQRRDIGKTEIIEAREYLAASLLLSGSPAEGKKEFMEILKTDAKYEGPDPSVFKSEIVTAFGEAQAEYASIVMRSVSDPKSTDAVTSSVQTETGKSKPLYKKWWFYAGMAAALLVVAGAVGSGSDDTQPPRDTGTVTVEVDVP